MKENRNIEYMALSDCSRQAMWIKTLLRELGINIQAIPICGDNQGSIFIGSNPVQEKWSKHIDICYHYIWQCIEEGHVTLYFVKGAENPANMCWDKIPDYVLFARTNT